VDQRRSLRTARVLAAALAVAALVAAVPAASAQTAPKKTREELKALQDAHKGDFDYLLGDWEFTAVRKMPDGPQKFRGYWSALRLDDGQVLDEYRVVSDEGETWYVTSTLRNYNVFMDRWELVGASSGTGLLDFGTARREGDEMKIEQTFGVASGEPSVLRIRYHDIQKDRFSWTADRSTDGGKTWVKDFQQIEARRIGPSRSLPALAPARKR
jgi:opacity protein-like surface antigen